MCADIHDGQEQKRSIRPMMEPKTERYSCTRLSRSSSPPSAHARVSDHAGSPGARDDVPGCGRSRDLPVPAALPSTICTVSAPRIETLRLNGWPMRSAVNTSPRPSRATAHDSWLMWIATPSSQGTCTLYSSPVSRRFANVVRFAPISDRRVEIPDQQLRAMCGRLRVGKEKLHVAGLVGAAMCSAC
jgi:hypothetical protein